MKMTTYCIYISAADIARDTNDSVYKEYVGMWTYFMKVSENRGQEDLR